MTDFDAIIKAAAEEIIGLIGYGFTEDTREQVDTILSRHFAGLEAEQWRPIETTPDEIKKDETPIDLWVTSAGRPGTGSRVCGAVWRKGAWREWTIDQFDCMSLMPIVGVVTHWRPLPPPPKEADHD